MDWLQFAMPTITAAAAAAAAYGGAWGAVRVEIAWIKKELKRHERELESIKRLSGDRRR